jgi:hypothetical protein
MMRYAFLVTSSSRNFYETPGLLGRQSLPVRIFKYPKSGYKKPHLPVKIRLTIPSEVNQLWHTTRTTTVVFKTADNPFSITQLSSILIGKW